jgi:hypothetical protein
MIIVTIVLLQLTKMQKQLLQYITNIQQNHMKVHGH